MTQQEPPRQVPAKRMFDVVVFFEGEGAVMTPVELERLLEQHPGIARVTVSERLFETHPSHEWDPTLGASQTCCLLCLAVWGTEKGSEPCSNRTPE